MNEPIRRKPGPKPKPKSEKVIKTSVSLQPQTFEGLVEIGGGVVSQGIEVVYERYRAAEPTKI